MCQNDGWWGCTWDLWTEKDLRFRTALIPSTRVLWSRGAVLGLQLLAGGSFAWFPSWTCSLGPTSMNSIQFHVTHLISSLPFLSLCQYSFRKSSLRRISWFLHPSEGQGHRPILPHDNNSPLSGGRLSFAWGLEFGNFVCCCG